MADRLMDVVPGDHPLWQELQPGGSAVEWGSLTEAEVRARMASRGDPLRLGVLEVPGEVILGWFANPPTGPESGRSAMEP